MGERPIIVSQATQPWRVPPSKGVWVLWINFAILTWCGWGLAILMPGRWVTLALPWCAAAAAVAVVWSVYWLWRNALGNV